MWTAVKLRVVRDKGRARLLVGVAHHSKRAKRGARPPAGHRMRTSDSASLPPPACYLPTPQDALDATLGVLGSDAQQLAAAARPQQQAAAGAAAGSATELERQHLRELWRATDAHFVAEKLRRLKTHGLQVGAGVFGAHVCFEKGVGGWGCGGEGGERRCTASKPGLQVGVSLMASRCGAPNSAPCCMAREHAM